MARISRLVPGLCPFSWLLAWGGVFGTGLGSGSGSGNGTLGGRAVLVMLSSAATLPPGYYHSIYLHLGILYTYAFVYRRVTSSFQLSIPHSPFLRRPQGVQGRSRVTA